MTLSHRRAVAWAVIAALTPACIPAAIVVLGAVNYLRRTRAAATAPPPPIPPPSTCPDHPDTELVPVGAPGNAMCPADGEMYELEAVPGPREGCAS